MFLLILQIFKPLYLINTFFWVEKSFISLIQYTEILSKYRTIDVIEIFFVLKKKR